MKNDYWKTIRLKLDWPVFLWSGGLLVAFVLFSLINLEQVSNFVNKGFDLSIQYLGAYWQFLMVATFVVGALVAISKYGNVRLGDTKQTYPIFFTKDIRNTYTKLKEKGIKVTELQDDGDNNFFDFYDLDNNKLQVCFWE